MDEAEEIELKFPQQNHNSKQECVCSKQRLFYVIICCVVFMVLAVSCTMMAVWLTAKTSTDLSTSSNGTVWDTSENTVTESWNDVTSSTEMTTTSKDSTFVGFTSWKTNQQTVSLGELVMFESISFNIGEFFDTTTSSFRCPYSGVYWVTLTINTVPGRDQLDVRVYKDSEEIMQVYNAYLIMQVYNAYFGSPGDTMSNSAIFHCQTNNTLTVRGYSYGTRGTVNGDINIPYSTLTVMLITLDQSDFVAFSVYLSTGMSYREGGVLKFNRQILNTNYYNMTTGQFTCPVTGIYYLTSTLLKDHRDHLQLGVEHQDSMILHSIGINSENSGTTITTSRLVECSRGDVITVKGLADGRVIGSRYTTLSGMLMSTHSNNSEMGPFQFIGFTATKTSHQTYRANTIIQFDTILVQRGNSFDTSTGKFNCPFLGVYFVSVNARRRGLRPLQVDVKHQSTVVFRLKDTESSQNPGCSDGICENPDNTISNSVLVRCGPGETIQVVGAGDGDIYGDRNYIVTTFTVMLVHR